MHVDGYGEATAASISTPAGRRVCVSAPPRLLPYSGLSRNQLITKYFFDGYPYKTILILLGLLHGISLSLRQLKRILRRSGLHRRTVLTFAHLHRVETQIRVCFAIA